MCAINPKHQLRFTLSVYTALDMPKEQFLTLALGKALAIEAELNADARLRWHVGQTEGDSYDRDR